MDGISFRREFRRNNEKIRFKFEFNLVWVSYYALKLFGVWVPLLWLVRLVGGPRKTDGAGIAHWGFYKIDRTIVFCWGDCHWNWYLPWDLSHVLTEVRKPDGTWVKKVNSWDEREPDGRWVGVYPYRYTTRRGEVQETTATVYVERMTWAWRWFKRLGWPRKVRTDLWIEFADEMGDARGSWKGGTIGCGWDLRKNETPEQSLRRMESVREFR